MDWRILVMGGMALLIAACGQQRPAEPEAPPTAESVVEAVEEAPAPPPPVEQTLLDVPNGAFTAIEPSELGVFGAPTIMEALGDLVASDAHEDGAIVHVTVREAGDNAVADIVRTQIPDDAVAAGHVRLEFRREAGEGWYPVNAYRRVMCRRGALVDQWTTEQCP
jgi:hypothetical protein